MKKLLKFASLVLCVNMVLSVPIEVAAATGVTEQSSVSNKSKMSFNTVQEKDSVEAPIVKELTGERTEFSKEFLLDNGSKMIAVYDQPVHFKNDKKEWVDLDNSIVSDGAEKYTNKTGQINVSLSKTASKNDMVGLASDNTSISWGYEGADNGQIKTVANEERKVGNEKYTNLSNVNSEATYSDVFKNVDLQYFVTSTGVKENIILKSSDVQTEFDITYSVKNVTAKQIDDYTISFVDKDGKETYELAAPYMTDANGEVSTKLTLGLASQENNVVKVKLSADSEYIKSSDRKFPVVIDPEITKNFVGMFVMDEGEGSIKLNHGPYYVSNNHYVITKVNSLPALGEGEQIISAKFNYDISNGDALFASESDDPIIANVHKITSFSQNVVNRENKVLDYDSITYEDHDSVSFDLTKLVKDWYAGTEPTNGFLFEANDTIGSKQVNIKGRNNTDLNPYITIIYKDFKGTENGMSYHSFESGQNATASISDYLGNLVVDQLLYEGTGSRLPATISATYNSIGTSWGFSFNQKITAASAEMAALGYDYIYTDKQGTSHYLKKGNSENKWYDEDGYGISLTVGENSLTVENSNTQTFALPSAGGYLQSEKDENNNTITYNYSNGVISGITDGSGRSIAISTNDGVITQISLPGGSSVSFTYSNGLLTKVVFPGGRMSRYSYDNSKLVLIEQADNISGSEVVNSKLGLTYTGDKVTRVTQYGSNGTEGNYLNFAYGTDNTTVFTDKQGREVTYTFDNSGNRISVLNANGYIENSAAEGLIVTGGADSFTKNYITESVNHTADYFTQFNGLTSSGGSLSIDTSEKFLGSNSIKIVNPVLENDPAFFTGGYKQFGASAFTGKNVTFSAYVKTSDAQTITNDSTSSAIGGAISIECYDSGDEMISASNSVGITGTEDWQRLSVSANISSEVSYFRIVCNLRYASGIAWFDGLQLEEGKAANDLNILQNADFSGNGNWFTEDDSAATVENGTVVIGGVAGVYNDIQVEEEVEETTVDETEPATYYVEETVTSPNDSVITYDEHGNQTQYDQGFVVRNIRKTYEVGAEEATEALEVTQELTEEPTNGEEAESTDSLGNKYIYQTVNVDKAGVMFNIVGKAKADSVPLSNANRTFGIALNIYYYDGETAPETHYQEFNSNTDKQQSVSLSVVPNYTEKVIDHVAFAFVYGYNKNTMTIYNAMLNIAAVGYSTVEEETTEPSSEPTTEEPATEEPYDDYVDYEVLSEEVDTSQPYMSSSTAYDSSANYVVSKTDEAGVVTEYEYDAAGNVTSLSTGDYYVEYAYDAAGNVTSLGNELAESTYTYNGVGNVSAISHNGFSYTFNYDIYNQLISTAVGNVTIAAKTYSADGLLTRTDFANNDYFVYTYDDFGNLTQINGRKQVNNEYIDCVIAKFTYNKKGLVTKAEDISGETVTYYQYDFSGNKIGEYRQTAAGDLSYRIGYNSNGDKVEKTSVNGQTKTITSGTDNDGKAFVDNDGVRVESSSDDFGRITEVKTLYSGTNVFSTLYSYCTRPNSNATSNNVHTITQKYGENNLLEYYYSYDESGNIAAVSETTNLNESFERYYYDSLNQLTIALDTRNNTYTRILYDEGGNIEQVVKSNYDTVNNQPSTEIYRNTYTYGDNNWKDKLTAFNGQTITYDAMGNPLQYRDGLSFKWENGRQLHSVTQNNAELQMKYDSNGLRTQKGNVHYYYDSDNNLIAMVSGNSTLLFYYDESGNITSFSLGGNMYFYVKNLQGDIINIADSSGTVLVRYDYDVFGKITAIKNGNNQAITDTSSIAFLNPLRYRGYVYDDETGLYYLQSRYYDPVTGRFLNADVYFDTESGSPLSTNMFAYCENSFLYKIDINGEDACWIQSSSGPGHTSLLLQDNIGGWWYFYWGPNNIQMLFLGNGLPLSKLNTTIKRILIMYRRYLGIDIGFDEDYIDSIYFKGNFSQSVEYMLSYMKSTGKRQNYLRYNPLISATDYIWYYYNPYKIASSSIHTKWKNKTRSQSRVVLFGKGNPKYNLLTNNCMQMSAYLLRLGTFSKNNKWYQSTLKLFEDVSTPGLAYDMIKLLQNSEKNENTVINLYNFFSYLVSGFQAVGINDLRKAASKIWSQYRAQFDILGKVLNIIFSK